MIPTGECCFKNTVDIEINKVVRPKTTFQPVALKCLLFHTQSMTATEPITWIDGHTFVLVSNWYSPVIKHLNMLSRCII